MIRECSLFMGYEYIKQVWRYSMLLSESTIKVLLKEEIIDPEIHTITRSFTGIDGVTQYHDLRTIPIVSIKQIEMSSLILLK